MPIFRALFLFFRHLASRLPRLTAPDLRPATLWGRRDPRRDPAGEERTGGDLCVFGPGDPAF